MENEDEKTIVACGVCGMYYEDWFGSTPCCGSIAYQVVDGVTTKNMALFASLNGGPIEPVILTNKPEGGDN